MNARRTAEGPDAGVVFVLRDSQPLRTAAAAGLGACAGAAAAYLLDPDRGRARRARLRDKTGHTVHVMRNGGGVLARDLSNRGRGVAGNARYRIAGRRVDDRVLHERVRAELGRHVAHPHAVQVQVRDGAVTLTGDVLEGQDRQARKAVRRVPGVRRVETRWTVHRDTAGVPQLQGRGRPREPVPELFQQTWSPTARLLAGCAGVTGWVMARRLPAPFSWAARGAAAAMATRAVTNLPMRRLTGVTAGRRAVDIEDAVTISAPVREVWSMIADYSAFEQCMPDVLEVRRSADGRVSHWKLDGPAGIPIRFDAEETRREEGREIVWKTVEGQLIAHTGAVRLTPEGEDRTRVQVQLTYNPLAGAAGHAVARLLGTDPRRRLREDLSRLKTYAESRARRPVAGSAPAT
ncbi:putative membrane protein [Thermocatellispora tengchongensis]|uniref:Putative membrane protein n=1 Tax=Thermocatellispora tengchongensis TaxID=1073253 RepID=A0A840P9N4_9ACTN|nr:SRPBCC family protein [Thermocatellispora tengchongensis]MBB5135719.1 putative membrane protein [Thermocatellispora tengchongensis]